MEEVGKNESIRVLLDGTTVIAEGDIDLAGGPLLDAAIMRVESAEPLVIDLAAVEFIDSSGLRSLLAASRRAEARGTRVVLRKPSSGVVRLLTITGTTEQFDVPGSSQPETSQPETSQPETSQPETSQPETSQHGSGRA